MDKTQKRKTAEVKKEQKMKIREDLKKSGSAATASENVAKMAGKKWQELSEDDRKPYMEMAQKDKVRYEKEIASGLVPLPRKTKSKGEKDKKSKDPNKPKRGQSSFLYYVADFRKSPDAANVKHLEILKLAGAKWKTLSADDRKKYEEMEKKDKERYQKEMASYKPPAGGVKKSPKKSKAKVSAKQQKPSSPQQESEEVSLDSEDSESDEDKE